MRPWRRHLPGGGFLLLVGSCVALAAFVAWGLAEPELDRAWWILQESDLGLTEVGPHDARRLDRTISRHPEIALDRLGDARVKFLARTPGGWSAAASSYLVVGPPGEDGLHLKIECRCAGRYPAEFLLEVGDETRRLVFEEDGAQSIEIRPEAAPHGPDRPFLARLAAETAFGCTGGRSGPAGIRVSAEEP